MLPGRTHSAAQGGRRAAVSPAWSPRLIWARGWARIQPGGHLALRCSQDGPRG